ncbi:MAG: CAP domain-containing protein [Candidatus Lernaella stagnicola]|nr:CAP domain-containing protein [Candidatus Lernaella stagnicola]
MRLYVLIVIAILAMGFFVACGSDETEAPNSFGSTDDDDDDGGGDGSLFSEECDIDYSVDMDCDGPEAECTHARLLNEDRYAHPEESDCAQPLFYDDPVAAVAEAHSRDMCERGFFDHANPDGESPFDRMEAAGLGFVAAGENIYMACGMSLSQVITQAEIDFMDEPECEPNHRSNILARNFKFVGVGIYECDDGCIYLTQDFITYAYGDIRTDQHEYCPALD